jgi:membrane protein DedA with SNARE-associated domain
MNPFVGLLVSLVAIFIGATINYSIGYYFGDTFFEKYGKYFFIKKYAYREAKRLFAENENFYTFYGRLIPLVRQLMSLPAGIVRMPYWKFISLTLAGSMVWHIILISLGYFIGDNMELIKRYIIFISIAIIIGIIFLWLRSQKTKRNAPRVSK